LSDNEYKIISNKYKIESDCYTTILLVKSLVEVKREGDERNKKMLSNIRKMLK
jgi:hypothetical protein